MGGACWLTQGNLGCENQSKRLRRGVIAFSLSLVIAIVMLKVGVSAPYRLALFLPFLAATNGLYMALFKT